jgi:hypothetical protein
VTAHPDVVVDLLDVDAAAPLHPAPLGRYVAARRAAERDQPLGYRGVQAAGHRIFPKRVLRGESADLEGGIGPGRVGADDADLGELADGGSGQALGGCRASTVSASVSSSATHPGPLSAHCASTMSSGSSRRACAISPTSVSSRRSLRTNGGAAKASRPLVWRMRTRPAPHCCTICPSDRGTPPCSSQARAEPRVG